jgi:hypothetical protein
VSVGKILSKALKPVATRTIYREGPLERSWPAHVAVSNIGSSPSLAYLISTEVRSETRRRLCCEGSSRVGPRTISGPIMVCTHF